MAGGDALRFVSFRGGCRSHDRDRGWIETEVGNVLGVEVACQNFQFCSAKGRSRKEMEKRGKAF